MSFQELHASAERNPRETRLDAVARDGGDAPGPPELGHHALPRIAETRMSAAIAAQPPILQAGAHPVPREGQRRRTEQARKSAPATTPHARSPSRHHVLTASRERHATYSGHVAFVGDWERVRRTRGPTRPRICGCARSGAPAGGGGAHDGPLCRLPRGEPAVRRLSALRRDLVRHAPPTRP